MLVAGLDVGRRRDRTALVLLDPPRILAVHILGAAPLREQAAQCIKLVSPCRKLAIDATGLGLGLAEALAEAGLPVLQVHIVAGAEVWRPEPGFVRAGKRYLVQRAVAAVSSHQLRVPSDCPGRDVLLAEMQRFVPKWNRSGTTRFEAASGHDDTVLALALALLAADVAHAEGTPPLAGHPGHRV